MKGYTVLDQPMIPNNYYLQMVSFKHLFYSFSSIHGDDEDEDIFIPLQWG